MTILWFWTLLVAAPFGMAAYLQAAEPGWKLGLGVLVVAGLAVSYILFGLPGEMFRSDTELERHPDRLKFRASSWVVIAAVVCLAGAVVGRVLRSRAGPEKLGLWGIPFSVHRHERVRDQ